MPGLSYNASTLINVSLWLGRGKFWVILYHAMEYPTDADKIAVIVKLPRPYNAKGVQVFMGHCGYYRRFIYMYAEIARPMYALLIVFEWD